MATPINNIRTGISTSDELANAINTNANIQTEMISDIASKQDSKPNGIDALIASNGKVSDVYLEDYIADIAVINGGSA